MQTCTEQQMQPDAANPVQVPAAATLPISGAEQQLGKLPDETECIQPGSTTRDTALQLMHRAASVPLTEAESPRSDAAGEYCMRLPVADKAELSSAIISDTLAALPVPPQAVSHVQGPILEVHQVDGHSVDIKIVHSFRASYTQPIEEVRQTAALAWQQQHTLDSELDAEQAGTASDTSSSGSGRQQGHGRGRGVHLHRPHSRHHSHHHHHHHIGHHRADSVEQCVECTELIDEEECMLPPNIKRCTACVVHEDEHDASIDTEHHQPSSSSSSLGLPSQPNSRSLPLQRRSRSRRSSAGTAEPAAAPNDLAPALGLEGAAAAAATTKAPAAAGASPFSASPFQAAGAGQQPSSRPALSAATGAHAAVQQQGYGSSSDFHTPQRRPPRYGQQQQQDEQGTPVLAPATGGRRQGCGQLSVEVLRGGGSKADSGNSDNVVSPTAISDASDDVQAQLQQWQRRHAGQNEQRLGWRFEQQQLLQQLLQEQSSAMLYPEPALPRQQQQQPVHVRMTHKRTAHGHEEVRLSHPHEPDADVTPPGSPLQQQEHQHQRQSDQQLQLVRQEQEWMHSPTHRQQQQQPAPWEQRINQLDMNVLRPPAGFTPLSGQGHLPQYVMAQEDMQQHLQQHALQQQQQQPPPQLNGTLVPAASPQMDRYAPHPRLVAHLQGKSPMARRHPALGFQPRCEWELDPRKVLVGRRLAVGGFAEVFLGKYEGTVVAIKRLLTDDASTIERFVSEVRLLARLRHPNLILFMGYCITPELCIVSEYMSKGSLYGVLHSPEQRKQRAAAAGAALPAESLDGSVLAGCGQQQQQQLQGQPSLAEGQLPLAEEIRHQQQSLDPKLQRVVAISVARGMAYLHSRTPPILHLDLKTPNILLDDRWRVKITDFGLSRARQKTFLSSTAQGGTPEWMAPEVLRCEDVAEPADVYSYGVVLWELITGRPPWESYNPMQVVAMVGFRNLCLPLPASAADPFLLDMCRRCLDKVPQQRPTFTQVVSELDQHYGPPAWSAHAQPLLAPTLRLPLPAVAQLLAATVQETQLAGSSSPKQQAVAAATAALALQADSGGSAGAGPAAASAEAEAGPGSSREAATANHTSSALTAGQQLQLQGAATLVSAAGAAGTAPPKLLSPFGGAQLPPWSVESVIDLASAAQTMSAAADAVAAPVEQQQQQEVVQEATGVSTAPSKLFSPFGGGTELPPCSVESVPDGAAGQSALVRQDLQLQVQQAAAGSLAPPKLFSPFGGGAELPPWSVESVASLAAAQAYQQDTAAASAEAGVDRQPPSRLYVLRQASSSDTSSSSSSGSAATGQLRTAGGLGGRLGSSMAVSTQPGSNSSTAALDMQNGAALAGQVCAATFPAGTSGTACQQQSQQQLQQRETAGQAVAAAAMVRAGDSSPAATQPGPDANADATGFGARRDSRDSSPFEDVQFPAGAHVYLTPLKVGSGFQGQVLVPSGSRQAASAAPFMPRDTPPAAAAADNAPGKLAADPFGELATQSLDSYSSGGSSEQASSHPVQPARAAVQQRTRQLDFSAAPCLAGVCAGGSSSEVLPAALQERMRAMAAATPTAARAALAEALCAVGPARLAPSPATAAAAAAGGPGVAAAGIVGRASAPSVLAAAATAGQHGQARYPSFDAATGASWTQSLTGLSSSRVPSDGSVLRSLWPSMTSTNPSVHSMGLPVALDSPRHHRSSNRSSSRPASRQESPRSPAGSADEAVSSAIGPEQQQQQLSQYEQDMVQQQQVCQMWPVLLASPPPDCQQLLQQQQQHKLPLLLNHSEQDLAQQLQPAAGQQQGTRPKGPGHDRSATRSTSFQRKGRFMVSTMTPEPPATWDASGQPDSSLDGARGNEGATAYAGVNAVSNSVGSTSGLMSAYGVLHAPHWGPFGVVHQPGWPVLGSFASAPPPNVNLTLWQQQQQMLGVWHEQGLAMQMSAPARLGARSSQPGTPATTPTAPILARDAAAQSAPSAWVPVAPAAEGHTVIEDAPAACWSDPAFRAGKGYWGSGVMREPSGAVLSDSSSSRSVRCSHEGLERGMAAVSLSPQARLQAAGSSGSADWRSCETAGDKSNVLMASMLQQVSNSGAGGMCYRSGRFHVTVEQLQAWQQRQQELQQQHAHLPHKSNSTGALLAAAGMAAAAEPAAVADVPREGVVAPQQLQQQQQPLLQRQPSSLHASSSCSSLQSAGSAQQQVRSQVQPGSPAALELKHHQQQQHSKTARAGSASGAAAGGSMSQQPTHTEDSSADTKRLCDLQTGANSSTGNIGSPIRGQVRQQQQQQSRSSSSSSASCLKLKAAVAAKAPAADNLAYTTPPGPGKPPVVPCKSPSPAATPCLSPKLQRAKSRDYCKGRFQVHESPLASHMRHDQRLAGPAGSSPSHTICVAELQHLQKQALAQLPEQQQVNGLEQLQQCAGSPSMLASGAPDSKQTLPGMNVSPAASAAQLLDASGLQPRSAGSSPLMLKVRTRTAGSSGNSGCLSDGGGSITPTAAAAPSSADGQAVVQQRGRFTVRQESRPSSRSSSAHGSKAGSPRGSAQHPGLSKLGSKSTGELALGAAAATAAVAPLPGNAASCLDQCTPGGPQQELENTAVLQALQQEQPASVRSSSIAGSDGGSSTLKQYMDAVPAAAAAAAGSMPTVADHLQLPPIKTVSKKGRFVVTQLTPASTACCTPKSAGAATTPTAAAAAAAAAAAGVFDGEVTPAVTLTAAGLVGAQQLSVSALGPLVTCPVCAVAQVMPQLPDQLSGQLLGLVTETSGSAQQQAGNAQQQGASGAAAAACDAIAAAISGTHAAVALAGSSAAGAGSAGVSSSPSGRDLVGAAGDSSTAGNMHTLHTCSSCGAPLPPMSQQEYQSAAAEAAAGVLDVAAAAAASLGTATGAVGPGQGCEGSGSSSMQASWHEGTAAHGAQLAQGAELHQGASPRTPQGLLAIAAARVLAARQQQQLVQLQRHNHHQQPQHRMSHDASSGPGSSGRTPGQRRSFEPHWMGYSCSSAGGGVELFSEASYQHSHSSSGRSSNSSIAVQPAHPHPHGAGSHPHGRLAGEVRFAGSTAGILGGAGTGLVSAAAAAGAMGSVASGDSSRSRTPVQGSSPAGGVTPHVSAVDSPMRWSAHQQADMARCMPTHWAAGSSGGKEPLPAGAVSAAGGGAPGLVEMRAPLSVSVHVLAADWPRSHPAAWLDAAGSVQCSSDVCSGDASTSAGCSEPGSSKGCQSPANTPAHQAG